MIEKILVLGGKGGVGKSSISAATAVLLSKLLPNKKILLISFDMAHNLSDLFKLEIGNKLTKLTDNLWGIEPDPNVYAEEYTIDLISKMKRLMKSMPIVGMIPSIENFIDTTFTADSIPLALKNAIFFQKILDAEDSLYRDPNADSVNFQIIVADFPPTGNMLALFEIPEDQVKVVLKYSLNFYNSIRGTLKNISKMWKTIMKPFVKQEEKRHLSESVLGMLQDLEKRGERITELIHDVGSLRLVTIPEKASFEEIKRARDLTQKYISLDGVHINMVIPHSADCTFCNNVRATQLKYTDDIKSEFKHLKIWQSNRLEQEPIGIDGLSSLGKEVYGNGASADEILNPK